MRPDDRRADLARQAGSGEPADAPMSPLDASLTAIDTELNAAGAQARRALHGRTQPTRFFAGELRERLLGADTAHVAAGMGLSAALPRDSWRSSRLRPEIDRAGEHWAPTALAPRLARRTPTVLPRARWSLLAAAALTGVLVVGALGARSDWLLPAPSADPSSAASPSPSSPPPSARPSEAVLLPLESPASSAAPAATEPPSVEATPKPTRTPTPTPTPKPTAKPEPTKPAVGPMSLVAKACPGGVVLDWTKPSATAVHYHVLRSLGGSVPATWPADGAVDVESATSWSGGTTDGFDAGLGGGITATYRAFAFDAEDHFLVSSPARTVTTIGAIDLGPPGVALNGPGSITVSWSGADLSAACFTYGKLVASEEDSDPSYLRGSPYLAVIESAGTTSVALDGLPSDKTVWLRYELIRATGTGKFIVGRTDVAQVTYP